MAVAFTCPYIGAGDYGVVVFILIGLVWLIANILKKKSSQQSKGPTAGHPRPRTGLEGESDTGPRAPSLSQFLRRLTNIAEEEAEPRPPRHVGAEGPRAETGVPMPSPPRRPTVPEKRVPGPAPVPELVPELGLPAVELAERRPAPPQAPETDAYITGRTAPPRISQFLGADFSASEVRKGIVLAEILGRPRALRRWRGPAGRR